MIRRPLPPSRIALFSAVLCAGITLLLQYGSQPHPVEHEESAMTAATKFMGEQRAYPDGSVSIAALRLAYHDLLNGSAMEPASPDSAWRSIGPTNVGGRVLALAVNQSVPSEVWVGTATGGLWKLIDSGTSYHWKPIETGFPTQSVGAIYIDSANRKLVFIGTGEVYSYLRSGSPGVGLRTLRGFYGTGIYRSTNDGASWEQVLNFPDSTITAVNKIIANPRFTRSMYAATSEGVYKSYDQGVTWQLKLPRKMAMDLVINRIDTTRLFASVGDQDAQFPGIYRSTDAGETWTQLNVVPTAFTGRTALAIGATNPKIVYAGISDRFAVQGLYRSTDSGDSWQLQNISDYTQFQGWFTNVVEVNPLFFGEVLCGGIALWKSQNNGTTLTRIDPQSRYHVDIHAITYQRGDSTLRTFYIGTDGGVYKSTDDGLTFSAMNNGFIGAQFYNGLAIAPADSTTTIGGTQDNGTWKYNGSSDWQSILGGDGSWCAFAPLNPNVMLAQYVYISPEFPARSGVQVSRSIDGGASFGVVFTDTTGPVSFTTPIVTAHSGHTMYLGTSVIYRSTTDGASWKAGKDTLDPFVLGANPCIALGVARSSSDTLYAATAPISHAAGFFASFDSGATWKKVGATALPNRYPTHIAVDPHNARTVYVTYSGFGQEHVLRSTDAGETWKNLTNNLPDIPTNTILLDPRDSGIIYVGNDLGVYVSTNAGQNWQPFSKGMPPAIVSAITMTETTRRILRVATHGRGVYERAAIEPRVGISESVIAQDARLEIFPTVVNQGQKIVVRFPHSLATNNSTLLVYDVTGKIVLRLAIHAEFSSPDNLFKLSTTSLKSGVYYIELQGVTRFGRSSFVVIK